MRPETCKLVKRSLSIAQANQQPLLRRVMNEQRLHQRVRVCTIQKQRESVQLNLASLKQFLKILKEYLQHKKISKRI